MSSDVSQHPLGPRGLTHRLRGTPGGEFSICTMVTDWAEYEHCLATFEAKGFTPVECEFLFIDNSRVNVADAYIALNEFLQTASAERIVVCHHDVELLSDGVDTLRARLAALDEKDPAWAVCGNAGHTDDGWPVLRISDPKGSFDTGGPLPVRVMSLDENFLVVKRSANLALSRDLSGFHHYGTDLCLIADFLGWSCWVIDFHLRHKSGGKVDQRYFDSARAMASKYTRALRPRWVYNVIRVPFYISGIGPHGRLMRVLRKVEKVLGMVPTNQDLDNPAKRQERDRRQTR